MDDMILIVEPLVPGLRRYARGLVRDATLADDLVQDCLERALTRWHQRRPDRDARSWLYAILHNLAIDALRRAARRGPHDNIDEIEPSAAAVPATQDEGIRRRDVLAALDMLGEDQRATLLLVGVEELTYTQAAAILDVPIGTVMSRLSRGRERLRAILAGSDDAGRPALRRVK